MAGCSVLWVNSHSCYGRLQCIMGKFTLVLWQAAVYFTRPYGSCVSNLPLVLLSLLSSAPPLLFFSSSPLLYSASPRLLCSSSSSSSLLLSSLLLCSSSSPLLLLLHLLSLSSPP